MMDKQEIEHEIDVTRKYIMDALIAKDPIKMREQIKHIKKLNKMLYNK